MAKNRILDSYSGLLDVTEVTSGMNYAIQNANRLLNDAKALFENESYATALSLAILSIEEAGKLSILRMLLCCSDEQQAKEAWKDYRNHRSKNAAWIIKDLFAKGARTLDDLKDCVDKKGEHTAILDAIKQLGFYTDCLADKHWSFPSDVIDKETCASIMQVAEMLCGQKEKTERENELWIHFFKEDQASKEALVRWHKSMLEEGLTEISVEQVNQFINGGNSNF